MKSLTGPIHPHRAEDAPTAPSPNRMLLSMGFGRLRAPALTPGELRRTDRGPSGSARANAPEPRGLQSVRKCAGMRGDLVKPPTPDAIA